jgi:hypothetical protein
MSTTDEDRRREAALDACIDAARDSAPVPSAALLARVLDAAEAEQDRIAARHAAVPRAPRAGLWARLRQGLGGYPALAGLAAAGVAGIWIGMALPALLPGTLPGDYVVDVAPDLALDTGGDF